MAVGGGGGHLYKNTCYLCIEKHREIGREHREFNLNPNVAALYIFMLYIKEIKRVDLLSNLLCR